MKRYPPFESFLQLKTTTDSLSYFEEYYESWKPVSLRLIELVKNKKEVFIIMNESFEIYVENTLITFKELSDEDFLSRLFFDIKEPISVSMKVEMVKGKKLNEEEFFYSDDENEAKYLNKDCPHCQHLMMAKDFSNVKSGQGSECSNWECRKKDISKIIWKSFNPEKKLKKESSGEYQFTLLDEIKKEWIFKKYPSLFASDYHFKDKFSKKEYKDHKCYNCGESDSHYVYGVSINKNDHVCVVYDCKTCHGSTMSSLVFLGKKGDDWMKTLSGIF